MRSLLDVNVLLALFDPLHVHHRRAHRWWTREGSGGWASCPLTQNGFVRNLSNPAYPHPVHVRAAISLLARQIALPRHEFWGDSISITDSSLFRTLTIQGPKQLTDIYLLGLAVRHEGRLVSFDTRIPLAAVNGAEPRHLHVLA